MIPQDMLSSQPSPTGGNIDPNAQSLPQTPEAPPDANNGMDGADKLVLQFGGIASQFEALNTLYPGHEEKFRNAINAMTEWLAEASGSLNIPSNGGSVSSSSTNAGY